MDLSFEKDAWEKGRNLVFGLDESGRGPLAGPVTAAAVTIVNASPNTFHLTPFLKEVNDSKKLSAKKREKLYEVLTDHPQIFWEVSWVTPRVIDRINILEATQKAMARAAQRLEKKIGDRSDFLLIDGRLELKVERSQEWIPRADGRVFSCAAASIIAKVFRDRTMHRYHRLFPQYGFGKHKGYPTKLHRRMLKKHGPCRIHRRSFNLL